MSSASSTIRKAAHFVPKQASKYHAKPAFQLAPKQLPLGPIAKRRVFMIRHPSSGSSSRTPAIRVSAVPPGSMDEQLPSYEEAALAEPVDESQITRYVRYRISPPRHLERAEPRPIDPQALVACDPSWEKVPIQYIRDQLVQFGPDMLSSCVKTTIKTAINDVPQTLRVHSGTPVPPTHIFAIPTRDSVIRFIPVHSTVLATHCSRLPIFPPSAAVPDEEGLTTLPVLPLRVPYPNSYPMLQEYLYLKKTDVLAHRLALPASTSHENHLLMRAGIILSLVKNANFLGVSDEAFWQLLDSEWATVRQELLAVPPPA